MHCFTLHCRSHKCCRSSGARLHASVLDTVEAADNLSFDPLSIFSLKPNTPSEGWSFDEDLHHSNTDNTSCNPILNIHLFKCLKMQRVMTHHRCSESLKQILIRSCAYNTWQKAKLICQKLFSAANLTVQGHHQGNQNHQTSTYWKVLETHCCCCSLAPAWASWCRLSLQRACQPLPEKVEPEKVELN